MGESEPRVEAIFHETRMKPVEERESHLKAVCGSDAALRARVEALLQADARGEEFLAAPAIGPAEEPGEGPGDRVGPYKLLQLIGEGGFGTVYMAEQEAPLRRRVALKLIKLGMDTRQVIARFEAERQALAMMDHPNIATVLDAGATDTGRPYFVMELVKGVPITEYCDQNNLSTLERLALFVDVCGAVQHAHQKGIIHRDLKPTNVMVTLHDGKPVPKVIDFGIAKATQQRLTEMTLFTEYRQFIGTPAYMSPEQAEMSGLDVDTRADIYSLGVLLYELLTGTTPLRPETLQEAGYAEIQRLIREQEPPKPSMRVSTLGDALTTIAKHRHVEPQSLSRLVRGDLDWIVMKALEKSRVRRYETAAALAADIFRHMRHEPVLAGPPGAVYRIRKFVRRHRAGVMTGALMAGALLLGAVFAAVGFVRASRERDNAQAAESTARQETAKAVTTGGFLDEMLSSVAPWNAQGREVTVRFMLDEAGRKLDAGALQGQPEIDAAIRTTIGNTYRDLGLHEAAGPHLERANQIRERIFGSDHRATLTSRRNLALLHNAQNPWGRTKRPEQMFQEVLQLRRRVLGEEDPDTLQSMHDLGMMFIEQDRHDEAEPLMVKALALRKAVLGEAHADTLKSMLGVASIHQSRARHDVAERLFKKVLAIRTREFGEQHPDTLAAMQDLAYFYRNQRRIEEEGSLQDRVLAMRRRVLGNDHPHTVDSIGAMARLRERQKRVDDAETLYRERMETRRRVFGENHSHALYAAINLASFLRGHGRPDEAETLLKKTMQAGIRSYGEEHRDTLLAMRGLLYLYWGAGLTAEADRFAHRILGIRRRILNAEDRDEVAVAITSRVANELPMFLGAEGRFEDAESILRELLDFRRRETPQDLEGIADALGRLADVLRQQHKFGEAEPFLRDLVAVRRRLLAERDLGIARGLARLGDVLLAQRKYAEAEPVMRECVEIRSAKRPDHWLHFSAMSRLGDALAGLHRFKAAEPLLIKGHSGMVENKACHPIRIYEGLEGIVKLYDAWGKRDEATRWRATIRPLPAESGAGERPGLVCRVYYGDWQKLPVFDRLKADEEHVTANFALEPGRVERVARRFVGYLSVPKAGAYVFSVRSDDGSRLLIGDELVVDNDGLHGPTAQFGIAVLAKGMHRITVEHFNRTGGGPMLQVEVAPAGHRTRPIPDTLLTH